MGSGASTDKDNGSASHGSMANAANGECNDSKVNNKNQSGSDKNRKCGDQNNSEENGGSLTETEENGGKYQDDDDTMSYDSKDSDDTFSLASRMPRYLEPGIEGDTKDDTKYEDNENNDSDDEINEDDLIEQIALENGVITPEENPYEFDTIGYYITKDKHENQIKPVELKVRFLEESIDTFPKQIDNPATGYSENEPPKESFKIEDRFDTFKKLYGGRLTKSKKRQLANKQTLVLAKIGSQYKYVAVPAYLPGQKLVRTSSIVNKGFVERAEYISKVKQLKKRDSTSTDNRGSLLLGKTIIGASISGNISVEVYIRSLVYGLLETLEQNYCQIRKRFRDNHWSEAKKKR